MTTGSVHEQAGYVAAGNCGGSPGYRSDFTKSWNGANRSGPTDKSAHPYVMSLSSTDCGLVSFIGSVQPVPPCAGGVSIVSVPWDSNDELALLNKLASVIRGHDFNAGVFAGTFGQTVSLIGDRAKRLALGIRALKKGRSPDQIVAAISGRRKIGSKFSIARDERLRKTRNPRSRNSTLWDSVEYEYRSPVKPLNASVKTGYVKKDIYSNSELDSTWLEASYGWLPLLNDIHEGARALANHMSNKRKVTFRAQRIARNIGESSDNGSVRTWRAERLSRIIYTFESETDYPSQLDLLGLKNPSSVAWELVPWSFAVDWVLPVGSFLEALSLVPSLRGSWVRTDVQRFYGTFAINTPGVYGLTTLSPCTARTVDLNRSVGSGGLSVPRPSFKNPISSSWMRTANQVALSIGLLRRHVG